jgi:hypothetical protein
MAPLTVLCPPPTPPPPSNFSGWIWKTSESALALLSGQGLHDAVNTTQLGYVCERSWSCPPGFACSLGVQVSMGPAHTYCALCGPLWLSEVERASGETHCLCLAQVAAHDFVVDGCVRQILCPPGHECPPGVRDPVSCESGRFSGVGWEACDSCPEGHACSGLDQPQKCVPGRYSPGGQRRCAECPPGRFGKDRALTTDHCSGQCRAGYACPAGSTSPTQHLCEAGWFSETAAWECLPCVAGQFSEGGADACRPCPPGRYGAAEMLGTPLCSGQCAAGHSCHPGSTNSTSSVCPAGRYSLPGAAACEDCPLGSFSNSSGASHCNPCPAGKFGGMPGLDVVDCSGDCFGCPAGSVSANGSSVCLALAYQALPAQYHSWASHAVVGVAVVGTLVLGAVTWMGYKCWRRSQGESSVMRRFQVVSTQLPVAPGGRWAVEVALAPGLGAQQQPPWPPNYQLICVRGDRHDCDAQLHDAALHLWTISGTAATDQGTNRFVRSEWQLSRDGTKQETFGTVLVLELRVDPAGSVTNIAGWPRRPGLW